MGTKSKEVQGLLYKVAELETLLIVLIGMLDAKGILTKEEVATIFGMAEIPEILGARIKRIETQGESMLEARKMILREILGMNIPPEGVVPTLGEPIIEDALDEAVVAAVKDPDKKLH